MLQLFSSLLTLLFFLSGPASKGNSETWHSTLAGRTEGLRDVRRTFAAADEEEDCHTYGQAVGNLFENHRAAGIGDLAVDFDSAVDRSWMHDERVRFGLGQAGFVQAEEAGVFSKARKHCLPLSLVLDAKEVDDVSVGD